MAKSDLSKSISSITEVLKDYLNVKLDLLKLQILEKSSNAGLYFFTIIAVLFAFFGFFSFLMFSFSFWWGERTGNLSQGFLIAAGLFLLVMILAYLLRKVIFGRNLIKNIAKILFEEEKE